MPQQFGKSVPGSIPTIVRAFKSAVTPEKEGRKEGWQGGHEEGREEGWENALHENILTLLTLRLGAAPEELAAQVRQVKEAERLEALFRCAAVVDSMAAFTRELAG